MKKKIFISYSWDSDIHIQWVLSLANRLEEIEELHVVLDKYDLDCFSDKNIFMEQGVFESDIIVIITTDKYVDKSNSRKGGVGIEAKMTSSRHWEESAEIGSSNIVVLRRSGDSSPNYLKEKLYIDFSSDENFEKSFQDLIKHIKGSSKEKRPPKKLFLNDTIQIKDFTRSEDIIKINHKKRKLLFDKNDCVDFSSGKKIKFELWETSSPRKDYYLILFKNTTIKETIDRFCNLVYKNKLKINELTILRPSSGDKAYLEKLFKDNNVIIFITEVTYSDFIWEYCIDDDAKGVGDVFVNPFFIDQTLINVDGENIQDFGLASEFIKNEFDSEQKSAALVIIAPGGMGKTTLCQKIANYFQKQLKSSAVFIQSETIKNSKIADLTENLNIDTIYDLYEIYAKICSSEYQDNFTYDKTTFELALLSGNIVVIVDGIDELVSIFHENFHIESFVNSIIDINNQLGSSKILLTSRDDIFSSESLDGRDEIKKLTLLGFDEQTCEKYLCKRFNNYAQRQKYTETVMTHIRKILEQDRDEHVLPFFVDLISGVVEENKGENISFDLSLQSKEYESNNGIIDCLVYSVLRRESKRQDLEISINEVVGIFQEMSSLYGDTFPASAIEEHISIYFNEFSGTLPKKIMRNPFLLIENGFCKFKYDFLADYFIALYLIELINLGATDDQFVSLLAKHAYGDKPVLKDVKKYFCMHHDKFLESSPKIVKKIIKKIDKEAAFKGNDNIYRALSSLVHLAVELPVAKGSRESATDTIKILYNACRKIEYLSLYGEFPPINFTDTEIWHSRFVRYHKFLSSKFGNTKFYYSYFDGIKTSKIPSSFDVNMFDSCRLGDLSSVIDKVIANNNVSMKLLEKDISNFLSSFFNRGIFKDQKMRYIKLPGKIKSDGMQFFDALLREEIVTVKVQKADNTYYEINLTYRNSVYNFINNNIIDSKIRRIINIAQEITSQ